MSRTANLFGYFEHIYPFLLLPPEAFDSIPALSE